MAHGNIRPKLDIRVPGEGDTGGDALRFAEQGVDNLPLGFPGDEQDDPFHPLEKGGGGADPLHAVGSVGMQRQRAAFPVGLFPGEESGGVAVGAHAEESKIDFFQGLEVAVEPGGGFRRKQSGVHADKPILAAQGAEHRHEVVGVVFVGTERFHPFVAEKQPAVGMHGAGDGGEPVVDGIRG